MKPTKPGRAQGRGRGQGQGQGQGQGKTRRKQPVQQNLRRARKAMKKMVELVLTREGAGGLGTIGEKSLGKKGQTLQLLSSSYTRVPGVQPSKRNDISASQGMTQELSEEKTTDAASSSRKKKRKKKKKQGLVDSENLTLNKQRTDEGTTAVNHGGLPPSLKGREIATDMKIEESSTKKKKRKKKLIVVDKKEARKLAALPRKARRREEKKLKKSKRQTFIQEKSTSGATGREGNHPSGKSSSGKASQDSKTKASEKKRQKRKRKSDKLKKEEEEQRKQQLIKANEREEKTIRQLERDLNFRKKKKTKEKITPMAFRDDGLDYLLDIVDPKFLEDEGEMEEGFMDLGEESNMADEDSASDNLENDDEGDDLDDEEDDDDRFGDGSEDGEPRTKLRKGLSKKDSERNSGLDSDDEEEEEEEEEEDGSTVDLRTKGKRKRTETAKNKAKSKHLGEQNEDLEDDDEQDEDDVDDIDDQEDEDENTGSEDDDSYDDDDDEDDEEEEEEEVDEDMEEIAKLPKMDPYGNVIGSKQPEKKMGAYVPPHKRAEMMGQEVDAERKAKLDRLRKQLKGAINRLSESNAQSICSQIEDLYLSNSRNDMNETLTSLVQDACIGQALTPERLAMEHILMMAVLHARVGSEVGAHLLQALASRFETLHGDDGCYGDGKELDNIVLLLVHLYNFKIVHCMLIYDLIKRFAEKFTERDIEMLLHILKSSGASLRKDDPSSLKDIILLIQGKANQCPDELKQQSRVKFMLETIGALRNNKLHKIPNYDPSHLQTLRALHRNLIKDRGHNDTDSTLRISLADLISAKERGRWWIVGSAWSGYGPKMDVSAKQSDQGMETQEMMKDETSQKIVELSRQQRMNTDLRRTIFSIIMTAEDFMDAFEKLVRLGQKGGRDREVVQVCLDCCQQEKAFNPYYAHLGTKLCLFDRKFRMAFQFALWDKLRLLEELSASNTKNLALLIAHLIASKALPLTVLKVIEFADINKATVLFLQTLLQDLLLERPDSTISSVFGGVASVTKLRLLREGLGLFMHHFLMKGVRRKVKRMMESGGQGGEGEGLEEKLKERIGIAETAMNEGDGMLKVKGDVGF